MDWQTMGNFAIATTMGVSAIGVVYGMYISAVTAIGAAKRRFKENKRAPMMMLTFIGFPLTELIYGYIVMQQMLAVEVTAANAARFVAFALLAGFIMCFVGILQGKIGAAACDALCETDQGVALYIAGLGITETVALFAMVFTITSF
ncbi:MAG: hypothetical protein LBC96_05820 [Lachnospiraceae bacterium]|jgi:V/A-type H+-transporting ATPase subunit K|nr:hypothetical protein [Lachnospiraceae bacterium]